jgi:hypothetical protein
VISVVSSEKKKKQLYKSTTGLVTKRHNVVKHMKKTYLFKKVDEGSMIVGVLCAFDGKNLNYQENIA